MAVFRRAFKRKDPRECPDDIDVGVERSDAAGEAARAERVKHLQGLKDTMHDQLRQEMHGAFLIGAGSSSFVAPADPDLLSASPFVVWTVDVCICLNAVQMGVQVDYPDELPTLFTVLEIVWTIVFLAEFAVKVRDFGLKGYFANSWRVLDFLVVAVSVVDVTLTATSGSSGLSMLAILRIFRLVRMLRVVKLLRAFRELILIVRGITDSVRPVFWASLLMVVILYACSILCVTTIGKATDADGLPLYDGYSEEIDTTDFNNYQAYGTIGRSMYSLFTLAVGDDIRWHLQPVLEHQPAMLIFYVLFIAFSTFGVMNVIVGVIVDNTMAAASEQADVSDKRQRLERLEHLYLVIDLVADIGKDQEGRMTRGEMHQLVDLNLKSHFKGLPMLLDADELYDLVDTEGDAGIRDYNVIRNLYRLAEHDGHQNLVIAHISVNRAHRELNQLCTRMSRVKDYLEHHKVGEGASLVIAPQTPDPMEEAVPSEKQSVLDEDEFARVSAAIEALATQQEATRHELLERIKEVSSATTKQSAEAAQAWSHPEGEFAEALKGVEQRIYDQIGELAQRISTNAYSIPTGVSTPNTMGTGRNSGSVNGGTPVGKSYDTDQDRPWDLRTSRPSSADPPPRDTVVPEDRQVDDMASVYSRYSKRSRGGGGGGGGGGGIGGRRASSNSSVLPRSFRAPRSDAGSRVSNGRPAPAAAQAPPGPAGADKDRFCMGPWEACVDDDAVGEDQIREEPPQKAFPSRQVDRPPASARGSARSDSSRMSIHDWR